MLEHPIFIFIARGHLYSELVSRMMGTLHVTVELQWRNGQGVMTSEDGNAHFP